MYPEYIELQGNRRSGTLYKELIKLQQENEQLKKQKDDVVEYIKEHLYMESTSGIQHPTFDGKLDYETNGFELLRMLGEIE